MDREQFEQAITPELRRRLERAAARVVGRPDAEDVVQTTLMTEFENASRIRDVEAYLVEAVTRDAQDFVKSEQRQVHQIAEYLDRDDASAVVEDVESLDTRIDVRRAVGKLPEGLARAVIAVYADGATWQEAADSLGVERKTLFEQVKKWLPYLQEQLGFQNASSASTELLEGANDDDERN